MGILSSEQQNRAARAQRREQRGVRVQGLRFDDRRQANLYIELKALERAGTISDLKVNARFPLSVNGVRVDTYVASFAYNKSGKTVVVDAHFETDVRKLQKRLVRVLLGIEVQDAL